MKCWFNRGDHTENASYWFSSTELIDRSISESKVITATRLVSNWIAYWKHCLNWVSSVIRSVGNCKNLPDLLSKNTLTACWQRVSHWALVLNQLIYCRHWWTGSSVSQWQSCHVSRRVRLCVTLLISNIQLFFSLFHVVESTITSKLFETASIIWQQLKIPK